MPNYKIYYGEEWSALYVDGELVTYGDHYISEQEAFRMLGVETFTDDSFMLGTNGREIAKTLDQLERYKYQKELDKQRALSLREQAAELIQKANELEGQ